MTAEIDGAATIKCDSSGDGGLRIAGRISGRGAEAVRPGETDIVGIIPDEAAIFRLAGAGPPGRNDEMDRAGPPDEPRNPRRPRQ